MIKRIFFVFVLLAMSPALLAIQRDPNGVNVNTRGATTVFITFGGLTNQVPAEAIWCGALIPAAPDIGFKCNPATIFGRLPLRYNQGRFSGQSGFTDIMTIPQTVARRAYEAAAAGQPSAFFYVRRFTSTVGGPDEYVFVTCRLAGGGARVPLSLLDVQLRFQTDTTVLSTPVGQPAPSFHADITYNGTGRLIGRWEVVLPGDDPPTAQDLLPEASLPVELRPLQRRYTQLERFNMFLPPTGNVRLDGPDPAKLPTAVEGLYLILLRIEASDDKEGNSNLGTAGSGSGIVHSGGVAGFPLPVLRYYVGSALTTSSTGAAGPLRQLLPLAGATTVRTAPLEFAWAEDARFAFYRLEVVDAAGKEVLSAVLQPGVGRYRAPGWFPDRVSAGVLRWRVVGLSPDGAVLSTSEWRGLDYRAE
ncbi:MAG TPA: hypothetical protein VMT00_00765 [Thermoanaerobaculia bacterium]|nr:hypothetical protein [Thermoanaerobaculia bacterium]